MVRQCRLPNCSITARQLIPMTSRPGKLAANRSSAIASAVSSYERYQYRPINDKKISVTGRQALPLLVGYRLGGSAGPRDHRPVHQAVAWRPAPVASQPFPQNAHHLGSMQALWAMVVGSQKRASISIWLSVSSPANSPCFSQRMRSTPSRALSCCSISLTACCGLRPG